MSGPDDQDVEALPKNSARQESNEGPDSGATRRSCCVSFAILTGQNFADNCRSLVSCESAVFLQYLFELFVRQGHCLVIVPADLVSAATIALMTASSVAKTVASKRSSILR